MQRNALTMKCKQLSAETERYCCIPTESDGILRLGIRSDDTLLLWSISGLTFIVYDTITIPSIAKANPPPVAILTAFTSFVMWAIKSPVLLRSKYVEDSDCK